MKWTIAAIKKANKAAGHVWFDKSHLRHSTVLQVHEGPVAVVLVTGDVDPDTDAAVFKLWKFSPSKGSIAYFEECPDAETANKKAAEYVAVWDE